MNYNILNYPQKDIDRFWSKVKVQYKEDGTPDFDTCMEWTAGLGKDGYGSFWFNGSSISSHRFIYTCFNGIIPNNLCVCHDCDNPLCVNPLHLWLGTNQQNTQDRCDKYRSASGERNGNSKFSDKVILEVRKLGKILSFAEVSRQTGVSESMVKNIYYNRNREI